jgi:hypothetical protein
METCECHLRKRELKKVTNVKMNQTWGMYGNVTTKFTIPLLCTHAIVEKQRKRKKKPKHCLTSNGTLLWRTQSLSK